MQIKKGQIVALTGGDYQEDYWLVGHMRALKDFDSEVEKRRFLDTSPEVAENEAKYVRQVSPSCRVYSGQVWTGNMLISWMQREGLLDPLDDDAVVELHIPDRPTIDELPVRPTE